MRYLIAIVLLCAAAEYAYEVVAWLSHGNLHYAVQCAWWGFGAWGAGRRLWGERRVS